MMFFVNSLLAQESRFGFDKIDFFRKFETKEIIKEEQLSEKEEIEDEWTEPVIDPTGRVFYYTPPKKVRDFLNNPNKETAEAYLEWNLNRMKKLAKAQLVLSKVTNEIREPHSDYHPKKNYIAFFLLKGCPSCKKQVQIIQQIYRERPDVYIETFVEGFNRDDIDKLPIPVKQNAGISSLFSIDTWPATFISNKQGKKFLLLGLSEKEKIINLLNGE